MLFSGYVLIGLFLDVAEGLWRGGQLYIASPQVANDFQTYGALALAFLSDSYSCSPLPVASLRPWLAIGSVLGAGISRHPAQCLRLWRSGLDQRKFLAHLRAACYPPGQCSAGWCLCWVLFSVCAPHMHVHASRLLRNRLNYWTPVFLLIAHQ